MSFRVENIIGIENTAIGSSSLINQLNNNVYQLLPNSKFLKPSLNPLYIKLASVLLLFICILGFYSYYSFLNLIYDFGISFLISLFITFFMFNIYRLLFCGTFGPGQKYHITDPNSSVLTFLIKYVFLITIGSLFSYVTYTVFFQKTNIKQYVINHPEVKIDIISIFSIVNKLGGTFVIIGFVLFIILFLLPQLIIEFKIDKQRLKQISRNVDQNHLNKILNKNSYLKNITLLKEDWRQNQLAEISNRDIFSSSNFKSNVGNQLYNYLVDKQF